MFMFLPRMDISAMNSLVNMDKIKTACILLVACLSGCGGGVENEGPQPNQNPPANIAGGYTQDEIYEDILFFEDRVNSQEKGLFYENYKQIGDAILDACPVYFPDMPLMNCARIFLATALKESTFYQFEANEMSNPYPTLGVLQIRKSSTVEDYNEYGNTNYLIERNIFYSDPTNEEMMGILYNVHLGMWYISIHARSKANHAREHCAGEDSIPENPGSIAVGLSSHRIGPTAYQNGQDLDLAAQYVAWIKDRYLELFARDGAAPGEDYFEKTLSYLKTICKQ